MILKFEDYILENKDSDELKEFISKNSPNKSIAEDVFVEISDEFDVKISSDVKFDRTSYDSGQFSSILGISITPPQNRMFTQSARSVNDLQVLNSEFKVLESLTNKILSCVSRIKNLMDFDNPSMDIFGVRTWNITFIKILQSDDLKTILSKQKKFDISHIDKLTSDAIDDILDIMNDSGIPIDQQERGISTTDFDDKYIGVYLYDCLAAEIDKESLTYEILEDDIVDKCREILRGY